MTASNRWGIELLGQQVDLDIWQDQLASPFDPYVEHVDDGFASKYLALRSSTFDICGSAPDVREAFQLLLPMLNVSLALTANAHPIDAGPVVEFVLDGRPRRHHFMTAEAGEIQVRGHVATFYVTDANGNVVPRPKLPSQSQRWLEAASLNSEIAHALRYLGGRKPNWFDLYKAYEALKKFPRGRLTNAQEKLFTWTANSGNRHHPINPAPPNPMTLDEARVMIFDWLYSAIDFVLARQKPPLS